MFFCCYREKRTMFPVAALDPALVLVPDLALIPTPSILQKRKAGWQLWHWWPVMEKSGTWVFFMISP
jgi:hypothetical protein